MTKFLTAVVATFFLLTAVAHAEDAETYFQRGNAYFNQKQYELAIQEYTKAIQLNPNSDGAYNNRGSVYEKLKQYERAFQEYSKALQLNPNSAKFYNNRERCLRAMGR